ncbi:hypothetical protein CC86DRAFT_212790 [Ophiobolus disseminans]|uniref:Uncharacterized protein n=1 Tax=Ophiobolus disseminans TaxID=1469910 RepID=A0A6A7A2N2_9PLEO|nr:hypothetical protein CC86DRAFT_212790 [Ophiobolus disseminans]
MREQTKTQYITNQTTFTNQAHQQELAYRIAIIPCSTPLLIEVRPPSSAQTPPALSPVPVPVVKAMPCSQNSAFCPPVSRKG